LSASTEVDSFVRASFAVKDVFQLPEGDLEYKVGYGPDSKDRFSELTSKLATMGYTPWLQGTAEDATLIVRKDAEQVPSKSRLPVILALLTLTSVVAFSLLEEAIYGELAPSLAGALVGLTYGAAIVALLGIHELGHRYAARRRGVKAPTPYVIPGIPDITPFFPSLGIISPQKEPARSRDSFFDVLFVGPLAGFVAAVALYAAGEFLFVLAPAVPQPQALNPFVSVSQVNPSVVQLGVDWVASFFTAPAASGFVKLSPLADAATVGFLLTFVGFVPMAVFDGGFMGLAAFGSRFARVATYVSAFSLIVVDAENYGASAIVVLLLAGRQPTLKVQDGISAVSRNRKMLFATGVLLALSSLPIPQNLATFPLG